MVREYFTGQHEQKSQFRDYESKRKQEHEICYI